MTKYLVALLLLVSSVAGAQTEAELQKILQEGMAAMQAGDARTAQEKLLAGKKMAEEHFGSVRFVGIKRHAKIGWVAKIQFDEFESLVAEGDDAIDALKTLRKRMQKIIDRYNMV